MSENDFWKKVYLLFGDRIVDYNELQNSFPEFVGYSTSIAIEKWAIENGMVDIFRKMPHETEYRPIPYNQYDESNIYHFRVKEKILECKRN